MRDLKQCLLDLLRSGRISVGESTSTQPTNKLPLKPKKLHEYTAADCNTAFLRKYYDLGMSPTGVGSGGSSGNVIYFNENLSMASKYDLHPYPLERYPSCPISEASISPFSSKSGGAGENSDSLKVDFSSDDDRNTIIGCCLESGRNAGACCKSEYIGGDGSGCDGQLDSFCTLCTSTFSYNKCCRYCENSLCGSKCNSERGSRASRTSRDFMQQRMKMPVRLVMDSTELY